MSRCVCGLAKTYHTGNDPLAYRASNPCKRYIPANAEAEFLQLDALLDQALTHLHWLTVGGEFANEVPRKHWYMASIVEWEQAKEFLAEAREKLREVK